MKKRWSVQFKILMCLILIITSLGPISVSATEETNEDLVIKDMTNGPNDGVTAQQLAEKILGKGVKARFIGSSSENNDLNSTVYKGASVAAGTFENGKNIIGLNDGIILSTGAVKSALGPNDLASTTSENGTSGDSMLNTLGGKTTFDASVLEFQFKLPTASSQVEFEFVLASEEYPEWISYHDIMGLYINNVNVALVPDSTQPVSVGTVNHTSNQAYYVSNTDASKNTEFDGFTTVLKAKSAITPGAWNTIKLAIADASDAQYDSAVFIGGSSLKAPTGLKAQNVQANGFALSWDVIDGVTGYDVFYDSPDPANDVFIGSTATNAFTLSELDEYTEYKVVVKSKFAGGGESPPSLPLTVRTKDATPPTAPTNLIVTNKTANTITLAWTESSDLGSGVQKYNLSLNGTKGVGMETDSETTSYTFTGLTELTTYALAVTAEDGDGNSSTRATLGVVTADATPPTAPKINIPVISTTTTTMVVAWSPSTDNSGIAEYRVYRDLGVNAIPNNSTTPACVATAPRLACEITGLSANTKYKVTVVAIDTTGNYSAIQNRVTTSVADANVTQASDTYTNEVVLRSNTASTDTLPPNKPGVVAVSNITLTSMTATWPAVTVDNAPTGVTPSGVAGYEVDLGNGIFTATSATTLTFNDLNPGTSYVIKVCAVDVAGNVTTGANCSTVTRSTLRDTVKPSKVTNVTKVSETENSVTLSWNAATDNVKVSSYEVLRDGVVVGTTTGRVFDATELKVSTKYRFTVRAVDSSNNKGDASDALEVTIADTVAPSIPIGLEATDIITTVVELTWEDSTDNLAVTGYDIFRDGVAEAIGTTNASTFKVTGLTKETTYTFTVKAKDAAGNVSAASAPLIVKTTAASDPPSAPDALYAEGLSEKSFLLSWESSEDDIEVTSYKIFYTKYNDNNDENGVDESTKEGADDVFVETRTVSKSAPNEVNLDTLSTMIGDLKLSNGAENATDIELEKNHIYVVKVKAVDSDGQESAFSEPLAVLVEANNGPNVTITRSKGDLTKTGVSLNYKIWKRYVTDPIFTDENPNDLAQEPGGTLTQATVKCVLRRTNGLQVATFYPNNANPALAFKKNETIGTTGVKKCNLSVGAPGITDGTYSVLLTVELPGELENGKPKKTKVIRTIKVDKTAPKITKVTKSNDIYGPDGKSSTTIRYSVDDEAYHTVVIRNSSGKVVRTFSKKAKMPAGDYSYDWNGKDTKNKDVPDGVYSVSIRAMNLTKTQTENTIRAAAKTATKPAVEGNMLSIIVESKAPTFSKVKASPDVMIRRSGVGTTTVSYVLSENAYVKVDVLDKDGAVVRTVVDQITTKVATNFTRVGSNTFRWDGRNAASPAVPVADGVYRFRITAEDIPPLAVVTACTNPCNSSADTGLFPYTTTTVTPKQGPFETPMYVDGQNDLAFTTIKNGDSNLDATGTVTQSLVVNGTNKVDVNYTLPEYSRVTTTITRTTGTPAVTTTLTTLEASLLRLPGQEYTVSWNGSLANGNKVAPGQYRMVIVARDSSGKTDTRRITINVTAE